MLEFKALIEQHAAVNEVKESAVKNFFVHKGTEGQKQRHAIYDAGIILTASGTKRISVSGQSYDYHAGRYLGVFLPMPVKVEKVNASPETPILMVGLKMDLRRIAEILLKIDRVAGAPAKTSNSFGLFTEAITKELLDPVLRLLKMLDKPLDAAMLSESIIDEIYYRVLTGKHVTAIRYLLEQRGQIQQISRAVEYITNNISEPVVVEDLAAQANMSVSHFHKNFKEVMQMSPLQYAKSMKLFRAQTLINEGKKAAQAAYLVGYNSPAQFSREYKRQFGFTPSETVQPFSETV